MSEPRAYTETEVREQFLEQVRTLVRYWAGEHPLSNVPEDYTAFQRCDGVAFSILSLIDGGNLSLPAFKLVTMPHEQDADYHREGGENWYPDDIDIAGALHDGLRTTECADER
jgi:hypothetical protein